MKECEVVIQEVDRCHIELLLRVTGGQVCKEKLRIILKCVINARDLPQTFISRGAC